MKNCALYKLFVALRDGEICERVWYELSPVHGVLRNSAAVRVTLGRFFCRLTSAYSIAAVMCSNLRSTA